MKTPLSSRRPESQTAGFTLLELLAVMSIVSILTSFTYLAFSSVTTGHSTANAVNHVANAVASARQTAISKGTPIVMAVSQLAGNEANACQAVLLFSYEAASGKKEAVGAWDRLPVDVRVAASRVNGTSTFYGNETGNPISGVLPLQLNGRDADYEYVVFLPDGTVDAPPAGPALTVRRLTKAAANPDYTLVIQANSGRSKILEN